MSNWSGGRGGMGGGDPIQVKLSEATITIREAGNIEIAKPVDYQKALHDYRASIIEECARVALTVQDSGHGLMSIQIAIAIRALKDKP